MLTKEYLHINTVTQLRALKHSNLWQKSFVILENTTNWTKQYLQNNDVILYTVPPEHASDCNLFKKNGYKIYLTQLNLFSSQ